MRIAMIGTGYVGLVSGACFADFGHRVCCVDKDSSKIDGLNAGVMPIWEPGLEAIVKANVVRSRKGLFVEVDNTDAEGRLILADALTRASEGNPQLIIDFATLTGAARVALGPDLPAMFSNDDELAAAIESTARGVDDPVWRMPLWDPYDENLKSNIADLANMANNAMAGCIYAALFLRRFVADKISWAHLDTWAWRDPPKPGRPKGGDALGLRAIFAMLQSRYSRD
jgi:leucyl aminopeptidase